MRRSGEAGRRQIPVMPDDDSALAALRRTVVGGVEHPIREGVILEGFSQLCLGEEIPVLP